MDSDYPGHLRFATMIFVVVLPFLALPFLTTRQKTRLRWGLGRMLAANLLWGAVLVATVLLAMKIYYPN